MNEERGTERLRGVLPVFQTPFTDTGDIDLDVLDHEIRWMIGQGTDGIVMGMVSEVLRLSDREATEVAERACAVAMDVGAQAVISVGAESTHVATERARRAEQLGATALMAVPPLATALTDDAKVEYYTEILRATSLPVVVQDASGYVGQPLSISMQAHIDRRFPGRVVFKPEAPPIGPRVTALLEATGGEARILEGTGGLALVDSHARGVVGTMPGADICWAIVALWRALESNDRDSVHVINGPLVDLVSRQTDLDSFLAVEKHLLQRQGIFPNARVRGPVSFELDPDLTAKVDADYERLRAAVNSVTA